MSARNLRVGVPTSRSSADDKVGEVKIPLVMGVRISHKNCDDRKIFAPGDAGNLDRPAEEGNLAAG